MTAIVPFVHWSHELDPNDRNRISPKLMFAFVKSCWWDQLRTDGKIKRVSPLPELRS